MLHVRCPQSGTSAYLDCGCDQLGHNPAVASQHHPQCALSNLGANIGCPPEAGCCQEDHGPGGHDAAANACPQDHPEDCPEPDQCRLWLHAAKLHELQIPEEDRHLARGEILYPTDPCPGGHCHKDIAGCTVCHPLVIEVAGQVTMLPVSS